MSYTGLFDGTRRAAKAHRCSLCDGSIPLGTTYHRRTYKFDGELCDETLHTCCRAELEWFFDVTYADEFTWDEVREFTIEEILAYGYDINDPEEAPHA